jgi:hypothetical protein
MIRMKHIDGQWCPVIQCHECGAEIRDHTTGMAIWGDSLPVRYVHKQTCDERHLPYSEELADHFAQLLFNSGIERQGK